MGIGLTKEITKVTNESINEVVNNLMFSSDSVQRDTVESIISQDIKIGDISGCKNITIGGTDQKITMHYVSYLSTDNISELSNNLEQTLVDKLKQNETVKRAMGSEWGTFDADEVNATIENIVKNIVSNSVTERTVNEQVAFTYGSVKQKLSAGDIVCSGGDLNIFNTNVIIENQVTQLSKNISQSVISNNLMQKILNDAEQTQDIEKSGIASVLAGLIVPIIIIGAIVAAVFIFGFKDTLSSILNWKFILVVAVLIGIYFTIAYFIKFWPWHRYYQIKLDSNKLRTDQCERNDGTGTFTSMDSCKKEINNPKSLWYYGKFWGYDTEQGSCSQYPSAFSSKDNVYARYNSKEECENESKPTTIYYFDKTIGNFAPGWTGPTAANIPSMCVSKTGNLGTNTTYSCQSMTTSDKNSADYPNPNYPTVGECTSSLNNSKLYYAPYCNTSSTCKDATGDYRDSCQYLVQVPQMQPYINDVGSQWIDVPFKRQEDICCNPSIQ